MISIRTLLCAASAACGLALGFNASATVLTVDVPCDSFVLQGTTLTCGSANGGGGSCSISGPSSAITGATVTLTGSCKSGSTLSWTGCIPVDNTNTCTLTSPATVQLNGSQGETQASKTVTFGAASCSISPSSATVTTGTSGQTFSANCNFTPQAYSWTGCSSPNNSSTCTVPAQGSAGSVTVGLTASSGGTSATAPNAMVTFSPPVKGVPTQCSDGTKTVVADTINEFNGLPVMVGLKNGQTAIFPFVVPSVPNQSFIATYLQSGQSTDATGRQAWISKTPCDMSGSDFGGGSSSASVRGVVDGGSSYSGSPLLTLHAKAGDVWYMMFQNKSKFRGQWSDSCSLGTCNLVVKPSFQF